MKNTSGKGGGARKYGRNKVKCAKYRSMGTQGINKKLKMARHKKFVEMKKEERNEKERVRRSAELSRTQEGSSVTGEAKTDGQVPVDIKDGTGVR